MTSADVESTVNEFIRNVVAGDFDAACALASDDLEYDNVPIGKNIGHEALKAILVPMMSGFDEVEFITHRQVCTGNLVLNERTDRFRKGDIWIDLPVAGVFEVDADGKVALWRDYFDMGMFTQQMAKLA